MHLHHVDQGALYSSLFIAGLAASLHCVGMCGPILVAFSQVLGSGERGTARGRLDFLLYHAGRIWTYAVLGFIAGWAGLELRQGSALLGWQRPLAVLVSVAVIAAGLAALGWIPGLRFDLTLSGGCGFRPPRWLAFLLRDPRLAARLLLGAVMGLLPCGMVYAMLLVTSTLASPLHSALGMVCFGAGTLPALSAVVVGSRVAPAWLRARSTRIAAGLLVGMGVFMLARALLVTPEAAMAHAASP